MDKEKKKSKHTQFKKGTCRSCENYNREADECEVGKNCKTNFGKCNEYIMNHKILYY